MTASSVVLMAAFLTFLYIVAARALFELSKPFRNAMCDEAERLLTDNRLPESERERIHFFMEASASGWVAWLLALLIPIAVVRMLWKCARRDFPAKKHIEKEVASGLRKFDTFWLASVLLSAPVGGIALLLTALPFITLGAVLGFYVTALTSSVARLYGDVPHFLSHHGNDQNNVRA